MSDDLRDELDAAIRVALDNGEGTPERWANAAAAATDAVLDVLRGQAPRAYPVGLAAADKRNGFRVVQVGEPERGHRSFFDWGRAVDPGVDEVGEPER